MERNALEDKLAKTRIPLRHRSEVEELKNKAKGFVLQAKVSRRIRVYRLGLFKLTRITAIVSRRRS
jgi:hypothetical protein